MSCATDLNFDTATPGGTAQLVLLVDDPNYNVNWNMADQSGGTYNGLWDCHLTFTANTGGGPANRATIYVDRVDSSCAYQETILVEETGDLVKGTITEYACTGVTDSITFNAGDGIRVYFTRTNGTRNITFRYSGNQTDSWLLVPAEE
jgi:hypothetical protein